MYVIPRHEVGMPVSEREGGPAFDGVIENPGGKAVSDRTPAFSRRRRDEELTVSALRLIITPRSS